MGSFDAMLVPLQKTFVFSVDVVNVLSLAVAAGSLAVLFIAGSLVDRWGARRVVTLGVCAMVAGALIIMSAFGVGWLLAGRIVGGVGGMTMAVASLATLNSTFKDDRQRAHVFGMLAAALGAAALTAPVLGGAVAQRGSWRLVPLLWIAVALCVLLLLRGVVTRDVVATAAREWVTPLAAGLTMSCLSLTALLARTSPQVALVTMCGFILALIVLTVRWRHLRRRGEDAGLNVSVLRSPGGLLLVGAMLAVGAVNLFFYSNLFLQYRFGLDASTAAANLIVAQCAVIAGGLAGGWISGWIGSLRTTALALALGVAAALGFLLLDATSGVPMTVALLAAFALPTGCLTGSLTKSFLDRADSASSGAASALRQGAWSLGSTLGGVVTGAVAFGYFTRDWQSALQRAGIADDVAAYAAESVRGGAVLVQLARTPGLEVLKVDSDLRTLLELTASQLSTMRLVGILAAIAYGLALLLILAAMWRIRAHSPNSRTQ